MVKIFLKGGDNIKELYIYSIIGFSTYVVEIFNIKCTELASSEI